ncbi:MAG: toll/interleukin-1 receptor domain-containing protein [Promethearchaeia archaeon]
MMEPEIEPPFDAYEGKQPYLFVSYSHEDKESVYPIIEDLHKKGVRIWYDDGIHASSDWMEQIADSLLGSQSFMVFVTPRSLESENVNDEIHLAKHELKKMFIVYLEDTELPSRLKLALGRKQALYRYKMSTERFWEKLRKEISKVTTDSSLESPAKTTEPKEPPVHTEIEPIIEIEETDKKEHVFICYSSKDKEKADITCRFLEQKGIDCWIAPRDISPGSYVKSIITAIEKSKLVVLIFSNNVNLSSSVKRELELAVKNGINILPFRIEDVKPGTDIGFYIDRIHWLDALTPPFETHLTKLANLVLRYYN